MKPESVIIGLCGLSGSGKTLACQKLVQELRNANITCCGFISPAVFEGARKIAINVRWLESGQERTLMTPNTQASQEIIGKWQIYPEAFEWINQKLKDVHDCQAFFCDEIGPFEVLQGKGWIKALEIVDKRKLPLSLITFRPSLRQFFEQRYPDMIIYDINDVDCSKSVITEIKHLFGIS